MIATIALVAFELHNSHETSATNDENNVIKKYSALMEQFVGQSGDEQQSGIKIIFLFNFFFCFFSIFIICFFIIIHTTLHVVCKYECIPIPAIAPIYSEYTSVEINTDTLFV